MAKKKTSKSLTKLNDSTGSKRLNPFESLFSKKSKRNILNKRTNNSRTKNVVAKRTKLLQDRYNTILKDYKNITKSNQFEDNRFGENSKTLDDNSKHLERFARTRSRKNRYNIEDNPTEVFFTSSKLGAVEGNNNFNDIQEDNFDASKFVESLYQQEAPDPELKEILTAEVKKSKKLSREEILEEVMMKAKLYKAKRQQEKLEMEETRERNDEAFNELLASGTSLKFKPHKGVAKSNMSEEQKLYFEKMELENVQNDDFNKILKEMRLEVKVKATEKTLTVEEKAQKEKRKLEELQKEFDERHKNDLKNVISNKKYKQDVDSFGNVIEANTLFDSHISDSGSIPIDGTQILKSSLKLMKKQFPFVYHIDITFSHQDLLKILSEFQAEENIFVKVCDRIMKSNSVHLHADNRSKLLNFLNVLVEHYLYITSLKKTTRKRKLFSTGVETVVQQISLLLPDLVKQLPQYFLPKLENMKKRLDTSLHAIKSLSDFGGDYGNSTQQFGVPHIPWKKLRAGGHKRHTFGTKRIFKPGSAYGKKGKLAAESKDIEEVRITERMYDGKVSVSPFQCWPSIAEMAFLRLIFMLFPISAFRHSISGSAMLLLNRYLSMCPIRGETDVVAAVLLCQLFIESSSLAQQQQLITKAMFSGEVIFVLEVLLGQFCAKRLTNISRFQTIRSLSSFSQQSKKIVASLHTAPMHKFMPEEPLAVTLQYPQDDMCCDKDVLLKSILCSIDCYLELNLPMLELSLVRTKIYLKELLPVVREKEANELVCSCIKKMAFKPVKPFQLEIKPEICSKMQQPRFLVEHYGVEKKTAKTIVKNLQKQVKNEKRNLLKEIRRDASLMANKRMEDVRRKENEVRAKRAENLRFIEDMNRNINSAVKNGARIAGGGTRNVDMKGRRRR